MQNEELVMITLEEVSKSLKRIENSLFEMKEQQDHIKRIVNGNPKRSLLINTEFISEVLLKGLKSVEEYNNEIIELHNELGFAIFTNTLNRGELEGLTHRMSEKIAIVEFIKAYKKSLEDSND